MDYDIKKGWFKNIEGGLLKDLMKEVFGNVSEEGDLLVSSYGVLASIKVKIIAKDKLDIVTTNKTGAMMDADILDSKRKLNVFAEKATGFDAKARMKRAQAKAKKGE
ncbi:MAG: DUF5611 family protein [Candidatus Methanomethylophilaceae archaeon]|nr:DUF5611 family protein [Candidatus Methanomethylophilaceae archaeon]MDD3379291.1 DUF5611 family protein [Candidatus Methanomethylophilaceae archaeon]MDY0224892.1 DUF5611 family protein [Candidatus Methanomethylophilaceae archaeon]